MLGAAVALLAVLCGAAAAETKPAYLARGDAVEARYRADKERLRSLREKLRARLEREAPDLVPRLDRTPPPVRPRGYGIVPKLVPDPPAPKDPIRAAPSRWSWPRTEETIARQEEGLGRFEADLRAGVACEKLVAAHEALAVAERRIDASVSYNRLWQAAVARDPADYDRNNALIADAVEREKIRDELATKDDAALRAREAALSRAIHERTGEIAVPAFLAVEQPAAHRWVIRVPVYTDVGDETFLRGFRAAVEDTWSVRDAGDEFQVQLAITRIPPARLYARAPVPATGAQIDLPAHLAHFPRDGAVLTTGGAITHVTAGWCVVLGPQDVARHVLAHEFGHVLGFRDVYFRGYRDLGADGYEVTESIADPNDIMGAPGFGPVLRAHFDALVRARRP